jgi:arylsulfatase A-like enzyme
MADQLAAPMLRMYNPSSVIRTPHLDSLAKEGVVFDSAYCNSPLCAPSRMALITGQLPSRIGAYDNATTLGSDQPTYAHYLRAQGYQTVLAGKMHFVGEQLHGYEKRLTADIYPADFGWHVNWDTADERLEWYHNRSSIEQAGECVRSNQLDFDMEVMFKSEQFLYDHVRDGPNKRPFALTVSLTHPHDPYTIHQPYWDMYKVSIEGAKLKVAASSRAGTDDVPAALVIRIASLFCDRQWPLGLFRRALSLPRPLAHYLLFVRPVFLYVASAPSHQDVEIPQPKVQIPADKQDPHSLRLQKVCDLAGHEFSAAQVAQARRAYFGAVSYVDDCVGRLLSVLRQCRLADNTIVVFSGDHGDMLGERGLWYKMNWFEMSARVPLLLHYPKLYPAKRVSHNVSTMDLLPTLCDLVGAKPLAELPLDGVSLMPHIRPDAADKDAAADKAQAAEELPDTVFGEYMGEGTGPMGPIFMIRRGPWKYVTCPLDPPQLFNLRDDPLEVTNLATSADPATKAVFESFEREAAAKWDSKSIAADVLATQRRRRFVNAALKVGEWTKWDYEVPENSQDKYIRSHMDLDDLERRARFPAVDAAGREIAQAIVANPHRK